MNRNTLIFICILSTLSINVVVLGDTKATVTISVCSFRPEEPLPTYVPNTPSPVTPFPTLPPITTQPETATTTPQVTTTTAIPTTENPTTEQPTTPQVTTTYRDDIATTDDETVEPTTIPTTLQPTTAKPTAAKPTAAKPTTAKPTIEEEDITTEEEVVYPRVMDDEDDNAEKLVLHKRLLNDNYYEWPKQLTDIRTKAEHALKDLIKLNDTLNGTVTIDSVKTSYNAADKNNGKVFYDITYDLTVGTGVESVWDEFKEKLESNNIFEFFDYFKNKTEEEFVYGACSTPGYLRTVTPCSYKSLNLFTAKAEGFEYINPLQTSTNEGFDIRFNVSCDKIGEQFLILPESNGNGSVVVNTKQTTNYSSCSIICIANNTSEYREGYTSFTTKVTDKNPTYNGMGSSIPTSATSLKNISISLKMAYPTNEIPTDLKVKLVIEESGKNKQCNTINPITSKPDGNFFIFENISFNCTSDNGELIKFELTFTVESSEGKIYNFDKDGKELVKHIIVIPTIRIYEDKSGENNKPADEDVINNADEVEYVCKDNYPADVNGLCCERNHDYGQSCTSMNITFPFGVTDGMSSEDWIIFAKSYLDTIRRVVFNHTNFDFYPDEVGSDNKGSIKIKVTFYELYIWHYSYEGDDSILVRRRSLQSSNIDWKQLSSPYVYINTILSYVNPAAVPEIEEVEASNTPGTIGTLGTRTNIPTSGVAKNVIDTLPEELKQFIEKNSELKEAISKAVKEVPAAVAETTTKTVEKINEDKKEGEKISVSFDVNQGLSVREDFPELITPASKVVILSTKPPTPNNDKPWAEKYWYVILIICIGAVLIIGIVGAVIGVYVSSGSKSLSSKKGIEKSNKIMETIIPIEQIKQENGISDEDIYHPYSQKVIMEGFLLKEGRDRIIGKWQRRYCVLYFDPAVLRIYDSIVASYYGKVYLEEKQSIPLDCYNGIEYREGSNDFTLILKVRYSTLKTFEFGDKEKKVHLKVEGENGVEICKKWIECFRDFKNQKPKAGDAWTRPLIIDENKRKISFTTDKATEKRNGDIVAKAQQRRKVTSSSQL